MGGACVPQGVRCKGLKRVAVILAGGKNTRFGRPKGLVRIGGVPIISRLAMEAVKTGIDDIRISANDHSLFAEFGLPLISDIHCDCGPMAGIHSVLINTEADEILIIPSDTPGITSAELTSLIAKAEENPQAMVIFAVSQSGSHPLCAVVRRALLQSIESAINDGRLSVNKLFHRVNHAVVVFDNEEPFRNLNTPGDLEQLEVSSNGQSGTL